MRLLLLLTSTIENSQNLEQTLASPARKMSNDSPVEGIEGGRRVSTDAMEVNTHPYEVNSEANTMAMESSGHISIGRGRRHRKGKKNATKFPPKKSLSIDEIGDSDSDASMTKFDQKMHAIVGASAKSRSQQASPDSDSTTTTSSKKTSSKGNWLRMNNSSSDESDSDSLLPKKKGAPVLKRVHAIEAETVGDSDSANSTNALSKQDQEAVKDAAPPLVDTEYAE